MDANEDGLLSLINLGLAYRKAKADLFYTSRACREDLSAFESELNNRLAKLQKQLQDGEAPHVSSDSWTLVPNKVKYQEPNPPPPISSDPQYLWKLICEQTKESRKVQTEFRLMEKLPIDFHVFSTLWINKVGYKLEEKLSGSSARGNRLRRSNNGDINLLSLGSTVYYLHAYRKWRDDAFVAMQNALEQKKSIVAITADVSSFYHKLDARFMLHKEFFSNIKVTLNNDEQKLHKLFIDAIHEWSQQTPLKRGLPVGLTASSVIANVALFELDKLIEQEIVPLYYGRYVDDIILVMENGANFQDSIDVWDWLVKRMTGTLEWRDDKDKKELQYTQPYLQNCEIIFAKEKNKTFLLSGVSGQSVLTSIRHEVNARTSEWRSLPDLPGSSTQLESMLLTAIQKDGVSADSLRKADKVSVRRAGFALKLRDIEAYARVLPPNAWQKQRHAFLSAFVRHVLVLPTFFDFFTYLSRILMIAVSCGDFKQVRDILDALEAILKQLNKDCEINIKAEIENPAEEALNVFKENLKTIIRESIECAIPSNLTLQSKQLWNSHLRNHHFLYNSKALHELKAQQQRYLKHDLAFRPLKHILLPITLSGLARSPIPRKALCNFELKEATGLLRKEILDGCKITAYLAKVPNKDKIPSGLLFPTRPLDLYDLYFLHTDPFSEKGSKEIASCLLALRGFKPEGILPLRQNGKSSSPIDIPCKENDKNIVRIAVTSWKTTFESCTASISHHPDPDFSRLGRLNHLINGVIRCQKKPDYLILPELSVPAHWFPAIVRKLKDISLISGIEYLHSAKKAVHNQVWAALSHDALGFPTLIIYRQDKQYPAFHEEQELQRIGNKILRPQMKRWASPPVICHRGFRFAILVCSELTNISYRAALRGKVDALFVPEWNQDLESFNALVESATLDIHAYIIQCNNRQYGDSRIRAPYKNSWKRDIVRVKGGIEDYFVTGEINIQALRAFQSSHRSPDMPFKPVPDGFEISYERRVLPSSESHD